MIRRGVALAGVALAVTVGCDRGRAEVGRAGESPEADGAVLSPGPDGGGPACIRGAGAHRLYLQGRNGHPDDRGRYQMLEDIDAIVHGEHYLLGKGAFAEWSAALCADMTGQVHFHIPNNDEEGSEARHELFVVHDGKETLIGDATDSQRGNMGYIPFDADVDGADPQAGPGDELLFRSTNISGKMFSVMIFAPPSEYMSWVEIRVP